MATIPQIRTRLLEVFPERQADVLAHVVVESHDDLATQFTRTGPPHRGLFFGYRADRKAREAILQAGAAMVFTRGVIIPAA